MSVQSVELIPNVAWNAFVRAISMMNFDENWIIVKTNPAERQLLCTVFRVKGTSSKFDKISKLSCSLTVSIRKTMKHENMPLKLVHVVQFQSGRTLLIECELKTPCGFYLQIKKFEMFEYAMKPPKRVESCFIHPKMDSENWFYVIRSIGFTSQKCFFYIFKWKLTEQLFIYWSHVSLQYDDERLFIDK